MTAGTEVAPKGLSSVPQLSAILVPQAPPALRFPGTDLVTASAALFHKPPTWAGTETRLFRVTVSAGTVGVSLRDPARLERNALNALNHDTRGTRAVFAPPPEEVEEDVWTSTAFDAPAWRAPDEFREPRPGRQVEGWSRKSRARMVRTLAQLDWTPLYAEGRPAVMGTLTYPGAWEVVAPTGKSVKVHFQALCKRYARRWGAALICAWKLEFQSRGAPHLHFLFVPPADPTFRDWLSATWVAIVAHPDPDQRRRHLLAGTGLDYLKGGRCFDPKRTAVYFSKHGGAAGGKEYQHRVPELWQETGAGPGRFWGYKGLDKVTADADLELADYVRVRRTLRRWSKQAGMTRKVTAMRVDADGVVTFRTRRRRGIIAQGGLTGGTVLVNDGPAFASALSRIISG